MMRDGMVSAACPSKILFITITVIAVVRVWKQQCGPMAGFIDEEERHHIVAWLKSGADETGYEVTICPIATVCDG